MSTPLILHPTDGSEPANKALDFACDLALSKKAQLVVLYVKPDRERFLDELQDYAQLEQVRESTTELMWSAARHIAERAEASARDRGIASVESIVVKGDPAREIIKIARSRNADTIVMGSRGLGSFQGLLHGSVSQKVAHRAPGTCVVVS